MPEQQRQMTEFVRKALVLAGLAIALWAAWRLRAPELLLFGAILFAIVLRALAGLVERRTNVSPGWALAIATVALTVVLLGLLVFFGVRLEGQTAELIRQLPSEWAQFRKGLQSTPLGKMVDSGITDLTSTSKGQMMSGIKTYATQVGIGVIDIILILAGGIYLAAQPGIYVRGFIRLIPEPRRDEARHVLRECGALLGRWMRAQLIAMVTIGVMAAVGLWAVGEPAPGALGVFAGLAEVIPVIGPIIAAVPALLMALTGGLYRVLATLILYIAIHQFESNILQPLLQRGLTSIPPVLNLFALAVFFIFFGLLGIVFAAPLTIVCMVVVRILYLREPTDASREEPPRWVRWLLGRFGR
ncbi:MAG: AI-2E family transporter [Caulobacteraceae bacterium]